eukprot:g2482.t1
MAADAHARSTSKARRRLSAQGRNLLHGALVGGVAGPPRDTSPRDARIPEDGIFGFQPRVRAKDAAAAGEDRTPLTVKIGRDTLTLTPGVDAVGMIQGYCLENACEDRVSWMVALLRKELTKGVRERPRWQQQILVDIGRNDFAAARPSKARAGGQAQRKKLSRGAPRPAHAPAPAADALAPHEPLRLKCGRENVTLTPGMSAEELRVHVTAEMEANGALESVKPVLRSVKRQLDRLVATPGQPAWLHDLALGMGRL